MSPDLLAGSRTLGDPTRPVPTVAVIARQGRYRWCWTYLGLLVLGSALAVVALRSAHSPRAAALGVIALSSLLILSRPRVGVYLIAFLAPLGDSQLASWYPFVKNLSSYESTLYIHNAVIVSPLEVMFLVTALSCAIRAFGGGAVRVHRQALFWPVMVFSGFMVLGLAHGLATGGELSVALWSVRPILYLPVMYVLATSLLRTPAQYDRLWWTVVIALLLEAVHSQYVITQIKAGPYAEFYATMGYLEHSASLHFNIVLLWSALALVVRGGAWGKRWLLPTGGVIVLLPYLAAERRSAVVALAAGLILAAAVLYRERRALFFLIVPVVAVLAVGYLAAFWNVEAGVGFPAQAVKSVIAPDQLSAADQGSNAYRQIETYNVVQTIRNSPLLGRGFGNKFDRPYPLPYIPFVWAEYMPHNSILWIWINAGVGGFVAMLYLFAVAIRSGVRAALRAPTADGRVTTLMAAIFVVMYVVYAYVDIAWDVQSMVLLGLSLAAIDTMSRVTTSPSAQMSAGGEESQVPGTLGA